MATGRNDFLWRSVVHLGAISLSLKVLLCLTNTTISLYSVYIISLYIVLYIFPDCLLYYLIFYLSTL